ncbi:MAG TPA: MFS transporter [Methylomirabilota bacterium]|nr:MFS transporter [Methylomirabilota bacterium]
MTGAPPTTLQDSDGGEDFARRHVRYNVVALTFDFGLFLVGLSFASQSTVLPAFAAHLGASNIVIGAIPALMTLGWYLPSLFAAGYTESLSRKLPFVLRYTVWERLPFLALAAVAFFLARTAPGLSLGLMLGMLLLITSAGGVLMPAWMDIVARTVPVSLRGRFFAVSSLVGSAGGLLGSILTAWVLARLPAPDGYGVCFLLAALCMGLSYVALTRVREPRVAVVDVAPPLRDYLLRVGRVLRADRNLTWFLAARGLVFIGTMACGFYTVYALRHFAAPDWAVGVFTAGLLAGQMIGNAVLGALADRTGHLKPLAIGSIALVLANLGALAVPSIELFIGVFVMQGVHLAAVNVSGLNVLLEFAPTSAARPTYVGLGTTLLTPVACGAPLVAGLLADAFGFPAVFVTAAAGALAGLGLLVGRVREPRRFPTAAP